MPNRIIKESAFTSDKVAQLSDFEFRLWVGLITQADDAGRGDARPAIIKGRVFALRERTTVKDIADALCALAAAGCVSLYSVGGKPYFRFPSWSEHQRVRNAIPKYPGPEEADETPPSFDISPQVAANRGEAQRSAAQSNPIQSNQNPNPIQECSPRAPAREATPPTLEDVKAYVREQRLRMDAEKFHAYYAMNGWKVKDEPMHDWRAACRYWSKNERAGKDNTTQSQGKPSYDLERAQKRTDTEVPEFKKRRK